MLFASLRQFRLCCAVRGRSVRSGWLFVAAGAMLSLAGGCDRTPGESRPFSVLNVFGEVGHSPGQFVYPRALAADPETGQLWIIDKAGRIQQVDPETGRASVHFRTPDIALGRPCGITVGPGWKGPDGVSIGGGTSLLYVADTHYHRVLIYLPGPQGDEAAPELIGEFGRYGHGPGEMIYLTDVAILTDDEGFATRLYVGEYGGNDRITAWELNEEGQWAFAFAIGSLGESSSPELIQFDRPQSLAVDKERGWLVVTDACNHRVGVFTLEGNLVRWIGARERASGVIEEKTGGMAYPFGLHLLGDGTALVTEYGNHCVRHFDLQTGAVLGLYGVGGRAPGHLLNPWAVTMLGGSVYVLDSGNARVQAFDLPRRWRVAGGAP